MTIVIDKIFNGDYQYIVVNNKKEVLAAGFKSWDEAMRFIHKN